MNGFQQDNRKLFEISLWYGMPPLAKPLWRVKENLPAALGHDSVFLPGTEKTAGSERRDVRGVSDLFVRDLEFNATRNILSERPGEAYQRLSQPLASGVACQSYVGCEMPGKVIVRNQQCIIQQL